MILKLLCKCNQNENSVTEILSFGRRVFYIIFCSELLIKWLAFKATLSELFRPKVLKSINFVSKGYLFTFH